MVALLSAMGHTARSVALGGQGGPIEVEPALQGRALVGLKRGHRALGRRHSGHGVRRRGAVSAQPGDPENGPIPSPSHHPHMPYSGAVVFGSKVWKWWESL